jgi:hypothetical protein
MNRSTQIRRRRLLATLAGLVATVGAPAVQGQNNGGPKPEIMLLIGSSRTMGQLTTFDENGGPAIPVCEPEPVLPAPDWFPGTVSEPSKMQAIKMALSGGNGGRKLRCSERFECIRDAAGNPDACVNLPGPPDVVGPADLSVRAVAGEDVELPHYRFWCCSGAPGDACSPWVPCGGDTGDITVAAHLTTAVHRGANVLLYNPQANGPVDDQGVLVAMGEDVKFGLMTFDGSVQNSEDWRGGFSFPNFSYPGANGQVIVERQPFGGVVEPDLQPAPAVDVVNKLAPRAIFAGVYMPVPGDDPFRPNLGIRNDRAPFGPLISSNLGMRLQGEIQLNVAVGESDSSVSNHNMVVAEKIREIVPSGSAPTAAALHDALEYYRRVFSDHPLYGDPAAECRDRALVYFADQAPTHYQGGPRDWTNSPLQTCQQDRHCDALPNGRCEYIVDPRDPDNNAARDPVCRYYPEGHPYKTSVEYASELHQSGVPLYVIGVAPQSADAEASLQALADAGSPGRGGPGRGGYYRADTPDAIRDALAAIRASQVSGNRAHTRPLVLYPRRGDTRAAATTKQWRINAWSEVPGGGDPFWYGKVERADLACRGAGAQADEPVARALAGTAEFSAVLAATPAAPRRVLARDGNTKFAVTGAAGNTMFNADGTVGGAFNESVVRSFTDTLLGAQVIDGLDATAQLRMVGRMMNGFFGKRGLPDGPMEAPGTRVLGAIVDSDLVPITAPGLPLTIGSYVTYANRHRNRPTLVATGANDGLVHLFRADTGAEVVNFVPLSAWPRLKAAASVQTVNGPMEAGDVATCRNSSGAVQGDCPAALSDESYRTLLVGGVGAAGTNLFGVDVTETTALAGEPVGNAVNLGNVLSGGPAGNPHIWDITASNADPAYRPKLGRSVSRPVLTHVRDGDKVRAAVIVGCGDDPTDPLVEGADRVGRCVLVLDALTGRTIQVIDNADRSIQDNGAMLWPMTGTASVWPRTGIAPAERAYIGDANGSMWRIDLSNRDPNRWSIDRIWPASMDAEDGRVGRSAVGRPALVMQESGRLAVLFSTGEKTRRTVIEDSQKAYVVSVLDYLTPGPLGNMIYETRPNWEFPLAPGEKATSEVSVVGGMALFTTAQATVQVCTSAIGRLYGVHATEVLKDVDGNPTTFNPPAPANGAAADDRRNLTVRPMLPTLGANGVTGTALALQLPPGRVAYGVTIADVPSCTEEDGTVTEVVMNLADDGGGRSGAPRTSDMIVESVQNGTIVKARYNDSMFAKARMPELSLCLNCGAEGKAKGSARQRKAPFASTVSYWGSTFTE